MSYCKKSAREIVTKSRYRGLPHAVTGIAIDRPWTVATCCGFVSPASQTLPTSSAHHEIATSAGCRPRLRDRAAGRKIGALHKKQTGGDPMQSKAQIDQILRQKCE